MPSLPKNPVNHAVVARPPSFDPEVALAFGTVVRTRRLALGLAQDQFALLANIDRSYFGKLERGQRQPSLALMLRVADGLGCSCTELMAQVEQALKGAACVPSSPHPLYAHFSNNLPLAQALDQAVLSTITPQWRSHKPQVQRVRHALRYVLSAQLPWQAARYVQDCCNATEELSVPLDLDQTTDKVMALVLAYVGYDA